MTRKRYIKLLMANGSSRNYANLSAIIVRATSKNYETAYHEHQKDLKSAINEAADAIQAVANAAVRLGIALTGDTAAFAKTYRVEIENP